MRLFTRTRRTVSRAASGVGRLRLSAKTISGTGIIEPIPGFLYCNGAAISRATYKALFDEIGTAHGAGDGSTTFNLPDYRGRFLAGHTDGAAGSNRIAGLARGAILGTESHGLSLAETPAHEHNPGTLNITSSGAGPHAASGMAAPNSRQATPNVYSHTEANAGHSDNQTLEGSTNAVAHSHPASEFSGATEDGTADGLTAAAGAAHQNVHPHQGIGGVLIAY